MTTKPIYANTIHIYGMIVKTGKKGKRANRDYQDPESMPKGGRANFTYRVSDEVTIDDVAYYLESKKHVRVIPIDGDGNKIDMTIGMDRGKPVYGPVQQTYDRISLFRKIDEDFRGIVWKTPEKKGTTDE